MLPLTQEFVAQMIGVRRNVVSLIANVLQQRVDFVNSVFPQANIAVASESSYSTASIAM